MGDYLSSSGDHESAPLAGRHVESELLFPRQIVKLCGETNHVGNKFGVDAVVDHLEYSPHFASLHDLLLHRRHAAVVVDSGEGNDRDFIVGKTGHGDAGILWYRNGRNKRGFIWVKNLLVEPRGRCHCVMP